MVPSNPWNSYRKVATQTASPGQLVLMLYEGAIRFLERALSGFEIEDPAESNETISNNLLRTQEILFELNVSLNMQKGKEHSMTEKVRRTFYEILRFFFEKKNSQKFWIL